MLTARAGVDDRIGGLDDGADDYLVKPFELGELAARARALLRRNGDGGRRRSASARSSSTRPGTRRRRAGEPLALTPKEFALLRYLMSRPGEVLSEFELLTHVWDENANPLTRTVRVTVMTLRRKLAGQPDRDRPRRRLPAAGRRVMLPALDPGPADAPLLRRPLRRRGAARRRALPRPLAEPARRAALPGRRDLAHRAGQRQQPTEERTFVDARRSSGR